MEHVNITTTPVGRNRVRIAINAKNDDGHVVKCSFECGQASVAQLVRDMCRNSGLPEPWKG